MIDQHNTLTLRTAQSARDREACYELRHRVFVTEQGLPVGSNPSTMVDSQDGDAVLLGAWRGDRCVGTGRVHLRGHEHSPYAGPLELDRLCRRFPESLAEYSRLAVEPSERGRDVYRALTNGLYRCSIDAGARYGVLGCAPGLIRLYERLGFDRYGSARLVEPYGEIVPMGIDLLNIEQLECRRSPFAALARQFIAQRDIAVA